MVRVVSTQGAGDVWHVELSIQEGVYHIEQYRVRVEGVPLAPADLSPDERERVMSEFVTVEVQRHMRRGSLPPRGTRLDGSAVWRRE